MGILEKIDFWERKFINEKVILDKFKLYYRINKTYQ
jgi:hypothetical protein